VNGLVFREEDHSYWLDGVRLPSVTKILEPLEDFSGIPAHILKKAGDYGSAVHLMQKLYFEDDLDETTLDDGLRGPLEALMKWERDYHHLFTVRPIVERQLYHPKFKYAGTPDIVFPEDDIDTKTRKFNKVRDPLQLAGYGDMIRVHHYPEVKKRRPWVLELCHDGTYKFTAAKHPEAFQRFRFLLDHHNNALKIESWRKS
jgi:hypothetical protein